MVVQTAVLPCSFGRSTGVLLDAIDKAKPDIVLCVGLAGGRSELCLERVGINVQDARIRDNDGKQPIDKPVVKGGPPAHFATLPIKACVAAMRQAGLAATVSNTAGTFVCNHTFYGLMHELAVNKDLQGVRGGLIHVPWLPGQGQPSMPLAQIVAGLKVAIACALATREDIRKEAGALN